MTDPNGHGELLVWAAPIPLDQGRQAHVPLWAPVMVDAGVFSERVCRAARAKVDACDTIVPVLRTLYIPLCRGPCSRAVIAHRGCPLLERRHGELAARASQSWIECAAGAHLQMQCFGLKFRISSPRSAMRHVSQRRGGSSRSEAAHRSRSPTRGGTPRLPAPSRMARPSCPARQAG